MTTFPDASPMRAVRLTKREVQILLLIAQGHTSQEVADDLFLSTRTVGFHLTNIYEKLEVSNRIHAFRKAIRLGLIPSAPVFGLEPR